MVSYKHIRNEGSNGCVVLNYDASVAKWVHEFDDSLPAGKVFVCTALSHDHLENYAQELALFYERLRGLNCPVSIVFRATDSVKDFGASSRVIGSMDDLVLEFVDEKKNVVVSGNLPNLFRHWSKHFINYAKVSEYQISVLPSRK